jgi:branched-chain amino acid transport system permease protein
MHTVAAGHLLAADWIKFDPGALGHNFTGLTIDGLTYGSIYALIAIGYTLVYGVLRLINFAHSEVFLVGLFVQYFVLQAIGFHPAADAYDQGILLTIVYMALAMVAAMAASGGTAVLLERVAYRPLRRRGAPPLVFLITAIGASLVISQFFFAWRGANQEPQIRLVEPVQQFSPFGADVSNVSLIIIGSALVLMIVADTFVNRTKFGMGIRSVAQDPTTARLMGVDPERVIMLTFLVGGVLAGAAALLYSIRIPQGIVYSGGFLLGIKAFSSAVLGGIGNVRGALLGGILLGVAENWGQALFGSGWRDVIAFVLLIAVLMVRPTGILGESLGRARV